MLKLDDRDLQMLRILSNEGRISKTELAARVNLTPTPCLDRLKRLEGAGIVAGYRAEVELAKIAPHVSVFVVLELENHQTESFQVFERAIEDYDEIITGWALGGGVDYLLQIITRDIESYQHFIDDLLASNVGISKYFTYIVTKQVKKSGTLPFDALLNLTPRK